MSSTKAKLHQTLATLTVFCNSGSVAISFGWLSPVINNSQSSDEYFTLNANQRSWIASIPHLSSIAGVLLSSLLLDFVGRKFLLTAGTFAHLISWFIILLSHSIEFLYFALLIIGLARGLGSGVQSVYLGEISSPENRGKLGFAMNFLFNCAFLMSFSITTYCSYHTTALFNSILQVFFIFFTLFIVEPPQFLLMKNKSRQAEQNFLRLKGLKTTDEDAKEELEELKNNAYTEASKKSSYLKLLTYPANYKSLLIILLFSMLEGLSGYFPIMSFAHMLLPSTNIFTVNELLIILGALQIIWAIFLFYVVNRFNRRSILLFSAAVAFLVHTFLAFLYYVAGNSITAQYFPWLVFLSLALFTLSPLITHTIGVLVRGELFPLSIKPLGNCFSFIVYSMLAFLSTKIFLTIKDSYGVYLNFLIYSTTSLSMILFTYFILPETRNKSLVEIQEILENRNKSDTNNAQNRQ